MYKFSTVYMHTFSTLKERIYFQIILMNIFSTSINVYTFYFIRKYIYIFNYMIKFKFSAYINVYKCLFFLTLYEINYI